MELISSDKKFFDHFPVSVGGLNPKPETEGDYPVTKKFTQKIALV